MISQFEQIFNENICYGEGAKLHKTKEKYRDVLIHYDPTNLVTTYLYRKDRYPFELSHGIVNGKYLRPNPYVNAALENYPKLENYQVLDNAYHSTGSLELQYYPTSTLNAVFIATTRPVIGG